MKKLPIDTDYLVKTLLKLLEIPSPTGFTDRIVHFVGEELERIGLPFELTRRGAIRATLKGPRKHPVRAVLSHLDNIGAMVCGLKENGRLAIQPIGTWSGRFAEGARVTVFTDSDARAGTILPLKASGHIFDAEIDAQKHAWDNLEVRVDEKAATAGELRECGYNIGDFVAIDPVPRLYNDYINARHLDDKAGVASILAAAKAVIESGAKVEEGCNILFTISEEVGSGASTTLHGEISELVAVDNATVGPGQNSSERGVTLAMMDSSGPFDWHLTRRLLRLCLDHGIEHERDVFRHYRCDAASAVEAGNDIRTALVGFGLDASHGYERVHLDSLRALSELVAIYMQAPLVVKHDDREMGPLDEFTKQPFEEVRYPAREKR